MIKWIFVSLVLAFATISISGAVPLMAVSAMVEAGRGLIGTILEDIAPGHNKVKDPFALSNETLLTIEKINSHIASHKGLVNETLIVVKNTENQMANVNQRIFEIDHIADNVLNTTEKTNLNLNKVLIKAHYVLNELPKITATIENKVKEMMNNLARRLHVDDEFETASNLLVEKIRGIQNKWNGYNKILIPKVAFVPHTYDDLFNTTISFGAKELTDNLHGIEQLLTAEGGDKSILYKGFLSAFTAKGKIMSYTESCGMGDTYQNRLKRIYNLISINEYRALVMFAIAHKYFEILKHDRSAKNDIYVNFKAYINRTEHHLTAMKAAMELASTDIIECDPPQYMLDINTFSLTNLFSMIYLSTDQIGNRCSRSCDAINTINKLACKKDVKNKDTLAVKEYCPKQQCNGRIHNCEIKNYYEFCEAREGVSTRYHWIGSATQKSKLDCDGRWVDTMKESKCIECLCECSAEGAESTATRAFSFLPQKSDVANNKVVTNIRFRKKDNVVRIQIEEARLLPGGEIDIDSRRWVPLDDLVYRQNTQEGGFWKIEGNERIGLVLNDNYTFLSHNKKGLYLDEIVVKKGYIVTGARFKNAVENSEKGTPNLSAIQLEIFQTKFDYQKGTLSKDENEQHRPVVANNDTQSHNKAYNSARTKKTLGNLKISTESNRNEDLWPTNMELEFRMTGKAGYGKGVIPFFDARPATKESQVPLSGIGIVYRRKNTFGGFISPKLIGLNHAQYVVTTLTDEQKKKIDEDFWKNIDNLGNGGRLALPYHDDEDTSDDINEVDEY